MSAGRDRRLRVEADKLEAFCLLVRAASEAPDQAAFAEVSRAAASALRARFGGGTITSAFAWLSGPAAQAALASVRVGEVDLQGTLSLVELERAVALAKEAQTLQR
ncbi:hypothetical protein [Variovorax sp. N23]|uniref:hypothetical protein n=1 Tax=Variovorax sp. N23 TaxID=2980555 RepID=UPI0021C986D0|nr:hypothetical protein [Variovorax sp. N23]MCU4121879.1 hypothetical protein [Variovorax sp. N23]